MKGFKITKIEFNSAGFKEILNSEGVKGLVEAQTNAICSKANANLTEESEGFKSHVFKGRYGGGRWVGSVYSTDHASLVAETENKALSRSV